ncbi:MAG TPA: flagellar motor protein MotB [Bacteroidia bacterium]|jgi:chemotaxis protein MotB|nr:flagellar motor protein MotB [Bacteroidia bacterium]
MKKYIILLSGIALLFNACVPKKELISSQKRVKNLQADSNGTHAQLNDCNSQVATLQKEKADLKNSMSDQSANYQSNQANSNMTIADQAKRLKTLEALIQAQKDVMNKLKKTVADALINFKPDELTVTLKDGKLYVSLQEKLLFASGSAVVDPQGKDALKTLATVLNTTSGITVDVEGHTDSIPMAGKYEDNWALSTARATSIVRILTKDYQVNPNTIIASGRSKYLPVATNSTPEGRAGNRRTDIILSPDLTDLFKLLNQ